MAKLYWALAVLGGALALGTFFGLIGNYPATQSPLQGFFANRAAATACLLYTSPSPRDLSTSRMPSSA